MYMGTNFDQSLCLIYDEGIDVTDSRADLYFYKQIRQFSWS